MKRYDLEMTATGPVMEEHEQGAFVPFSEISGLAEQLADATRQCGVMAELLREVTKIVPAIGVAIDDLPVVDAFLERVEMVLAGQVLEPARNEALAMMMDELHDICVGLDAPGGAQNGAEAWEQVKEARDRVLASMRHGRPDAEWTDAATSPVAADYHELQAQHDQLQSKHKGALDLLQESHEVMRRIIPTLPQDCANRSDLLDRIEVALAGKQQNKPVTITETIRTAPERIWLQVGDQSHYHSEPFPEHHDEVSWCADSVVSCEVPYVRADLVGHSGWQLDTAPEGWKLVPFNPTTDQWNGLARAIIFWMRSYPSNQHTPSTLVEFITSYGYTVPKWMEEESEFLAKNHVISKGTAATLIYKAMLADGPASQGGEPCAIEPPLSSPA